MTEQFASWIGNTVTREDVVTQRIVDEFRATLAPHLFVPTAAEDAPPGLHWCLALPAHDSARLGPDGAEAKGAFLPPISLPRRMWAGGQLATFRPLQLNDRITKTSAITDIKSRTGKAGALCFVSVTHEVHANGELAVRERHDILFREAGPVAPASAAPAAPAAPLAAPLLDWKVDASPLLLFRFSAITFNGHRIHYDLPYAKDVEGYNGLLVHGPMQAALTLNQLSAALGHVPAVFDYRCVSPLISGQQFNVLTHKGEGGQLTASIRNAAGVTTIEATAHE